MGSPGFGQRPGPYAPSAFPGPRPFPPRHPVSSSAPSSSAPSASSPAPHLAGPPRPMVPPQRPHVSQEIQHHEQVRVNKRWWRHPNFNMIQNRIILQSDRPIKYRWHRVRLDTCFINKQILGETFIYVWWLIFTPSAQIIKLYDSYTNCGLNKNEARTSFYM